MCLVDDKAGGSCGVHLGNELGAGLAVPFYLSSLDRKDSSRKTRPRKGSGFSDHSVDLSFTIIFFQLSEGCVVGMQVHILKNTLFQVAQYHLVKRGEVNGLECTSLVAVVACIGYT